jgi:hypothetical protein
MTEHAITEHPIVEKFRKEWPPAFAGPSIDARSGNAIRWSTTQNRRSRGEIPAECFVRSGSGPTIVVRDAFLDWWASTLTEARRPPVVVPPPRNRRRNRAEAAA